MTSLPPPPSTLAWLLLPYLLAGLGLLLYLLHLPEVLVARGRVDIWGASHQLWHVLIFLGRQSVELQRFPGRVNALLTNVNKI